MKTPEQTERRADYLRGKLAKVQKELDAIAPHLAHSSAHRTSKDGGPNVLICVPTHSGEIKYKCMFSLMKLVDLLRSAGIRHELEVIPGCPLITVVRNYFANKAAFDVDKDGDVFTHALMVDADLAGFENGVMELLKADKPVAAVLYSVKDLKWPRIAQAVRAGVPPEHLREFAAVPDINDARPFNVNEPTPVRHVGSGVMLIKSQVLRAIADQHPEWKYLVRTSYFFGEPNPDRQWQYDFFQTVIDPETKNYVSEDFFFCDAARKSGFEVYALGKERTIHTGAYDFILNLPAIAALGAPPVQPAKEAA